MFWVKFEFVGLTGRCAFARKVVISSLLPGFRCFYSGNEPGNEAGILSGRTFHASQDKNGQGNSGRVSGYVWTDARYVECVSEAMSVLVGVSECICCGSVLMLLCPAPSRQRHWDRARGHSGPILPYHGTAPLQPALQWPRWTQHRPCTPIPVRHGEQAFHEVQPGKFPIQLDLMPIQLAQLTLHTI